jgi:hypothetical protein
VSLAVRDFAQPGEHLEAVHVRHHDVEQDQIDGVVGTKTVESAGAVLADLDGVGRRLQLELDDAADIRLVVHDENGRSTRQARHVARPLPAPADARPKSISKIHAEPVLASATSCWTFRAAAAVRGVQR